MHNKGQRRSVSTVDFADLLLSTSAADNICLDASTFSKTWNRGIGIAKVDVDRINFRLAEIPLYLSRRVIRASWEAGGVAGAGAARAPAEAATAEVKAAEAGGAAAAREEVARAVAEVAEAEGVGAEGAAVAEGRRGRGGGGRGRVQRKERQLGWRRRRRRRV